MSPHRVTEWGSDHFHDEGRFLQCSARLPNDAAPRNNAPHIQRPSERLTEFGFTVGKCAVRRDAIWPLRGEPAVAERGWLTYRRHACSRHDEIKMRERQPQVKLFCAVSKRGVKHKPLESMTVDGPELRVRACQSTTAHPAR